MHPASKMAASRPIPIIHPSAAQQRDTHGFDQPLGRSMETVFEVPSPTSHGLHAYKQKTHRRDKRRQPSSGAPRPSTSKSDKQQQQQQRKKYERQASQENSKRRAESTRHNNGVTEGDFVAAPPRTPSFLTSEDEQSVFCVNDGRLCIRQDLKDDFFGSEIPRTVPEFWVADLSYNQLTRFPTCFQLGHLRELLLAHNNLTEFVVTRDMPDLETLELQGNSIRQFPDRMTLSRLPSLRKLDLYNNNIVDLPPDACEPLSRLEELNLSFNKLQELPSQIALLGSLKKLNLSYNFLVELPYQICELRELRRLELRNNELRRPPQELAKRGLQAIFNFWKRTYQGCNKLISQRKMIVLGNSDVDMLSVVNSTPNAQHDIGELDGLSENTPALQIREWIYSDQEVVKLWLLRARYSETQRQAFFGDNSLYLLVWNMEQCSSQDDIQRAILSWVDLVLAKVGGQCHIFIVPTNHQAVDAEERAVRLSMVERCVAQYFDDRARQLNESRDGQARYLASLKPPVTLCRTVEVLHRKVQAMLQPSAELFDIPQYFLEVRAACEARSNRGELVVTIEEIHRDLGERLTQWEVTYALAFLNRLGDRFLLWVEGNYDTGSDVESLARQSSNGAAFSVDGRRSLRHSNSGYFLDDDDSGEYGDSEPSDAGAEELTKWETPNARRRVFRKHHSVEISSSPSVTPTSLARAKSTGHLRNRKTAATSQRSYADAARGPLVPSFSRANTPPAELGARPAPLTESMVSQLGQQPSFNLSNYVFLNVDWFAGKISALMARLRSLPRNDAKFRDGAISGEELATAIKKTAANNVEIVWTLLERILVRFNFIIPVHADNTTTSSDMPTTSAPTPPARDTSDSVWKPFHRLYIVPLFLPDLGVVPIHLGMGEIMLEHQFRFGRYVPPDLVSLILAQSKQTQLSPVAPEVSHNDGYFIGLACENACWRNALKQFRTLPTTDNRYTNITTWIVVEGNVLRVVGIGQLPRHGMILQSLEEYCKIVHDVLAELPGLYDVHESVLCSKCLLEQRQVYKCGTFSWDSLAQDRAQRLLFPGIPIRKHCGTCDQSINLESLVHTEAPTTNGQSEFQPGDREELLATVQQLEGALSFLLQECVRQASVPFAQLRPAMCRVGVVTRNEVEFLGSGSAFVDAQGRLLIATVDHLFPKGIVGKKVVIGTETHWVATVFEPVRPILTTVFPATESSNPVGRREDDDWCFVVPKKLVRPLEFAGMTTAVTADWVAAVGQAIPPTWAEIQANVSDFPFLPLTVTAENYPQQEQFVRLLGFPGSYSLASCCGRVIQPNANGFVIVDTYSEQGSSGGPLVDSDGRLLGVLSSSYTTQRYARVQPLLPALKAAEGVLQRAYKYAQGR